MVRYFSLFFLLSILAGIQCRSIVSSNLNEANPSYTKNLTNIRDETHDKADVDVEIRRFFATQSLALEKILAEFAARTTDFKDYEEKAAQWLRLLKQMLQSLTSGKIFNKSQLIHTRFNDVEQIPQIIIDEDKKKVPFAGYNWLDDLFEFLDDQEIDGQSSEENQSHVKSRYENSSNLFSLINDNSEQNKNQVDRPDGKEFQELDKMLVDIQNQIERVRTNFEKFCSKHHSISSTEWLVQDVNEDQRFNGILTNNQ